ncbi:hypothetical protein ACFC8N_24215 [Streptomyces sp. NPDC055966]|uniref:hypothetical protein n=1 Tax=Streptomyces sp. NPDC055966 TaxID=3345669 RepID=UPI0035E14254
MSAIGRWVVLCRTSVAGSLVWGVLRAQPRWSNRDVGRGGGPTWPRSSSGCRTPSWPGAPPRCSASTACSATTSARPASRPPVLSATTGTSGSFWIPTRFSGDVLATVQATYPDGTPAGPTTWSPYQQFNTDFRPPSPTAAEPARVRAATSAAPRC